MSRIGAGFHDTDSCDEFPFAATNQSGALNGVRSGKSCAQLVAIRISKVGDEARQWHGVKATGSPTGREKCVRGHIPNKLNIAVGQAYKKFIKTQRLLNDDRFWLKVVS